MYANSVSVQTVSLRYNYQSEQSAKAKEGKTTANSEENGKAQAEETQKESSFSDILSIVSKNSTPLNNIKAYVQDSVNKVLEKIAKHASDAFSQQSGTYKVSVTNISITIEMEEGETVEDVKSELDNMLSEDGYWGVEKTSQRMFDFAHAIAGDDVEQLEKAKEAVQKGFKQAEAIFGGKLPQISYDTYDAAMGKFDNYISQLNSTLSTTYA